MGLFLLFAWDSYGEAGGMHDLDSVHLTNDSATAEVLGRIKSGKFHNDAWQLFDMDSGDIFHWNPKVPSDKDRWNLQTGFLDSTIDNCRTHNAMKHLVAELSARAIAQSTATPAPAPGESKGRL